MGYYDLSVEKYWVTPSGYFRLANTVVLGMGIPYRNLLFCHVVSEKIKDNSISMREYKNRTIYECLNNTFPIDFGSPALNIPNITIDDSPRTKNISRYNSDPLRADVSIAYGNYVIALTTPYESPQLLEPNYVDPDTQHTIMSDNPCRGRTEI